MTVSISIDVSDCAQAVEFYTLALGCEHKKQYNEKWQVVGIDALDIHIQEKESGTPAAAESVRDYARHWTPVHLDFGVADVRVAAEAIELYGGIVEKQSFSEQADIAVCADPFGNGFCVIRE